MIKVFLISKLAHILSAASVVLSMKPCWLFVYQEELPEEFLTKN